MATISFTKATKKQSKLRLALFGASGAGKTYTALRIAKGIGGKIAVIDSEHGSASKYSDRFDFDTVILEKKTISEYCDCMAVAQSAGYNVLIIDSMTHAWQELLHEVDKLANAKYGGNSFGAWSEGTPKQKQLVNAILGFNGHIIATMRCKTEWIIEVNSKGKSMPSRVGTTPEQGKGIEYEFDLLINLSVDHIAHIIKDRTGKFQDQLIETPGEDFGKELKAWLNDGEVDKGKEDLSNSNKKLTEIFNKYSRLMTKEEKNYYSIAQKNYLQGKMTVERFEKLIEYYNDAYSEQKDTKEINPEKEIFIQKTKKVEKELKAKTPEIINEDDVENPSLSLDEEKSNESFSKENLEEVA